MKLKNYGFEYSGSKTYRNNLKTDDTYIDKNSESTINFNGINGELTVIKFSNSKNYSKLNINNINPSTENILESNSKKK